MSLRRALPLSLVVFGLLLAWLLVRSLNADDGASAEEIQLAAERFATTPSVAGGVDMATSMEASGDVRWVSWLLDLHRFNYSTSTDAAAFSALSELTGVEQVGQRQADFAAFGTWNRSSAEAEAPGAGYRQWKQAIYDRIDAGYAEFLADIDDELLPHVHWGGARRGDIPELNEPIRVGSLEAPWLKDDDIVMGVEIDGVAVAYPVRILGRHELANDTIADVPVSLVYCTLCRSGLLFDRRIVGDSTAGDSTAGDGTAGDSTALLTFQTSGLLLDSNKVMIDNETESLWSHFAGMAIAGPLKGTELAQFPVTTTTWSDWLNDHPDTATIEPPGPTFFDDPERPALAYDYSSEAYANYYASDDVWFPIAQPGSVLDDKIEVIGLRHEGDALALPVATLDGQDPMVFNVGGRAFLVVPTPGGARVYSGSGLDGDESDGPQPIGVEQANEQEAVLADGSTVQRVPVPQVFWFAWHASNPATEVWSIDEGTG